MDRPTDPPAATAGTVLAGRYRLDRRLAAGGMASVWAGHDLVLARPVAVKVLHPHLSADEQFVARFRREAVAAARLAHPSIVAIYDTCTQDGLEAIVMELVEGPTLRDELRRRGRFDPHLAARVVADVADALAAAHAAGIVHRDVKPANVLLARDGRVLVTDFGIAKAADGLDLTGTGTTLGTAKYLAPEQVDPGLGPVDGRADVYAAGVVLYELLAGRPPFVADGEAATALARLHRDPAPLAEVVPGVDPALDAACRRALARRPGDRFPGAAALRDALRDALRGLTPAEGPPTAAVPVAPAPAGGDATQVAGSTVADPTAVASADRTRAAAAAGTIGAGAGGAPPDRGAAAAAAPPARHRRRRRRWPAVLVATIVLAALAVVAVLWAGTGDGDGARAGGPSSTAGGGVAVVGIRSFDPPPGDGEENDGDRLAALDGDPTTAWRTECYDSPPLGGLKPGVGLVLELAEVAALAELQVAARAPGWEAEAYVATEPGGSLADWGEPVARVTAAEATTAVPLDGAEGRLVLLWFTRLPRSEDCRGHPYGVSVAELAVR